MIRRLLVSALLVCGSAVAAEPAVVDLWPGKPPGETAPIGEETVQPQKPGDPITKRITNVAHPTLTIYRPERSLDTGAAVIVAPGGGYNILAFNHEGEQVAEWLQSIGVTGVVLKYRVPRRPGQPKDEAPSVALMDAQRAVSLVRSKAAEWGLDPRRVGMLGFSAGGHLTAWTATNFDERSYSPVDKADETGCRPDFIVLIYPGYLQAKGKPNELAPDIHVTAAAPPTFIAHAGDDPVSAEGSAILWLALKRAGVPAELHIYNSGGHGFGLMKIGHPSAEWPTRCAEWMGDRKILEPRAK